MEPFVRAQHRRELGILARATNLDPVYGYTLPNTTDPIFYPYLHAVRYLIQSVQTDPTASVSGDALYVAFLQWTQIQPAPLDQKLPVKIQHVDFHRYLHRFFSTFELPFTYDAATKTVTAIPNCSLRSTILDPQSTQAEVDRLKRLTLASPKLRQGVTADQRLLPDLDDAPGQEERSPGDQITNLVQDIVLDAAAPLQRLRRHSYDRGR